MPRREDYTWDLSINVNGDYSVSTQYDYQVLGCLYQVSGLLPPELQLSWPGWLGAPSSNTMFVFCLIIYYLSVSGITYDIVNSPPAFGVEQDANGNSRPVAILQYQVF